MIGIRGIPNVKRQTIIDKAFLQVDKNCNGFITPDEIKKVYKTSNHPMVRIGMFTQQQVFKGFLQHFPNQEKIQRTSWNDYFAAVSYSIQNDEHFIDLVKLAWIK